MEMRCRKWLRDGSRLLAGLAGPLFIPAGMAYSQAPPTTVPAQPAIQVATAAPLSLAECQRIALEQQPALAAHRASVASAHTQAEALQHLHAPPLVSRDLPIRRRQACLGVRIVEAELSQAEYETIYAVTRTYYSVIYARAQQKVASDLVASLRGYQKTVGELVKSGASRDYTDTTVDKITLYMRLAATRQAEAERGVERATAALREAMGVSPETRITVAQDTLPVPKVQVSRDQIVALALSRRGELTQTTTAAEMVELEVEAQGKTCLPTLRTFAAVADIHAIPVPQGTSNGEYRPGATSLEMPTLLAGSRSRRQERAHDLSARAAAVVDKTRNLIALEAEDAFLKWEEAARKIPETQDAAAAGARLTKHSREDFSAGQKVRMEDILTEQVVAAQAQGSYNEALYLQLISLAGLQRVTAGGFDAGLGAPTGAH